MKKYVYFFSAKVYSDNARKFFRSSGIYATDDKIITFERYQVFIEWLKTRVKPDFPWTDNNLTVESLSFLHEVEE